jgi:hypothetical protein
MNPKYPVYVISKGRWKIRKTVIELERIGVPYHIVIEPQEYKYYSKIINSKKIYKLPFSNLGQGSIPARNWVWEHSIEQGNERHWILDDNIRCFLRLNNNQQYYVASGTIFKAAEDFVDRYENIALSGFNYAFFAPQADIQPPFYLNTRVYSCILIKNDLPYRWRGKYNEDTDLSLRILKDGWCTILFNAFLAHKENTMTMQGGNTDELYQQDKDFDGRFEMAKSLQEQHPNIVEVVWKWGRWQHSINYRIFKKNKLIKKKGIKIVNGINNYGMKLVQINND